MPFDFLLTIIRVVVTKTPTSMWRIDDEVKSKVCRSEITSCDDRYPEHRVREKLKSQNYNSKLKTPQAGFDFSDVVLRFDS